MRNFLKRFFAAKFSACGNLDLQNFLKIYPNIFLIYNLLIDRWEN